MDPRYKTLLLQNKTLALAALSRVFSLNGHTPCQQSDQLYSRLGQIEYALFSVTTEVMTEADLDKIEAANRLLKEFLDVSESRSTDMPPQRPGAH